MKITRKEAISELKAMPINYPLTNGEDRASRLMQARDIAVEALEHPEGNVVAIVPCGDVISRQMVLDIVDSYSESQSNGADVTQDIISDIIALQPVNSQPQTGHWIDIYGGVECDKCGKWYPHAPIAKNEIKFCSECGAKMIEPQERSDKE